MTKLSDFRISESTEPAETVPSEPEIRIPVGTCVLAFDQSIAHTGWAVVAVGNSASVSVLATGGFKTSRERDLGKTEDKLVRATLVGEYVSEVISQWKRDVRLASVVHEAPLAGGGRMMSADSSLACAVAVRVAAWSHRVPVAMVNNQRMRRYLTGSQAGDKAAIARAVRDRLPDLGKPGPLNEATYDAIALALTYLGSE